MSDQSSQSIADLEQQIKLLQEENERLKKRLESQIKSQQKYYETHKEEVKSRSKEYMKTVDPEKRKKWNRTAYLKRKEKRYGLTV